MVTLSENAITHFVLEPGHLLDSLRHFSFLWVMTPFQSDFWREEISVRIKLEMPQALAFLFFVDSQSQCWLSSLPITTTTSSSLSLSLSVAVSLSAPSERVPHYHTVNAVSHTYPVTPPGHCAIKSQSVFLQTHGNQ